MSQYLLAIDQGTSSSRAILFDHLGGIVHSVQQSLTTQYPQEAWVEQEPDDIWESVKSCCRLLLAQSGIAPNTIAGIGITNQRETTMLWDRSTGKPVSPAIVWQDRRTSDYCSHLYYDGCEASISEKTGLLLDPYFSASKIHWLLENIDGLRLRAEKGQIAFGTVDTFLLWKLTGGTSHFTDATNASRTMLFNIHQQCWDDELLQIFNIPRQILPEVLDSADHFGHTHPDLFGCAIPITAVAGDQQSALIGQGCFNTGMAKSTYGTGCFLIMNTGSQVISSTHQLLSTVAYRLKGQTTYALEGSIFIAGAAIHWLSDGLQLIEAVGESEDLAHQVPHDHGVFLVPAFTGLGAPYWDPDARGAIFGLTRDTGIKEVVSAGLQSVCYQTRDLVEAMDKDGLSPSSLRVDGGMAANSWMLQFLANILGVPIERPQTLETTALGAAYLAGLQAGVFESLDAIQALWQRQQEFTPKMDNQARNKLYAQWQDAVSRVQTRA